MSMMMMLVQEGRKDYCFDCFISWRWSTSSLAERPTAASYQSYGCVSTLPHPFYHIITLRNLTITDWLALFVCQTEAESLVTGLYCLLAFVHKSA